MRLGVVGSRSFKDVDLFNDVMAKITEDYRDDLVIVSGGAKGADKLAREWAVYNDVECIEYLAQWDEYGLAAGYRRNTTIVNDSDQILAFWDGDSNGTLDTIIKAVKSGKLVMIQGFKK